MTTLRAHLHHLFAAVIAVVLVGLGATDAHATHFRYGTLRWEKTAETGTTITLKVTTESAWRCTFYTGVGNGCNPLAPIVATQQNLQIERIANGAQLISPIPLNITRSAINNTEDWFVGSSVHENIVIAKSALLGGGVRIYWAGNARISSLQDNNNDLPFRVEAIVSEIPNAASPAASILPIITVGYPFPNATFFIPAGDVEGDVLTWRISEVVRSSLNKPAPDGFDDIPPATLNINPTNGQVTWNTGLERSPADTPGEDLYAVQFIVRDSKGAETPVDALLRLIVTIPNPPVATINGSDEQYTVDVRPGNPVSFVLTGTDNDPGDDVTLTSGALPPGATMSPSLPTSGSSPRSSTFNWTPTLADEGNNYTVSFAVTDETANQDTISAVIRVLENFPPTISCPAVGPTVEATSAAGVTLTLDATVSDPDPDTLTVRWFVDGPLVETDTTSGPGSSTVSLTRTYAFTPAPHTVRAEVSDGRASRECTVTFTVVDTTRPVVTVPNTTAEATSPAGATVTFTATATDTVDGNVTPVTCAPPSGSTFPVGDTTVTCTATDSHGNTGTGTGVVTVQDTTPPVVTVPDTTAEATGPSGAIVVFTATATDTVDGPVTPVTCVPPSGSTFPVGSTTVTCTATDAAGNTGTGTGVVTVTDTTGPTVNVPNTTAEATGPSGAVVNFTATATDLVDGNVTPVICTPASGSTFPLGTTTVTCTATDSHGNPGSGTGTVTVVDTTGPVVTVPNTTAEATSPAGATVTFTATATDLVDGNVTPVTCVPPSGSTFPVGQTTVTCTAVDSRGNPGSGTGTVTVTDTTGPVVNAGPDQILEATSPQGAVATFTATAVDLVDGPLTATCVPPSGSTFPLGVNTVVCTATDSHGNTGSDSLTITVRDTTPPVITGTANRTAEATGPSGASVTWPAPTATDIADPSVPVTCSPASGSTFAINPPGPVTTVTCTAVDDSGNAAVPATFTVTVVDTTPPVFTNVPANITVPAVGNGAFVTYTNPTATDLVDLNRPVTCAPPSGFFFPIGTTPVVCTASDTRGNTATVTFTVTVTPNGDTKPPKVCLLLSPGKLWPPNHKMVKVQVILTVQDDKDPRPTCAVTNVTSSEPVTGKTWGNTSPDWTFSGLNLQLRAERYSKLGRTYTVTVVCSDRAGNTTTTKGTVRVPHDGSRNGGGNHGGGGHHLTGGEGLIGGLDLSGGEQDHNNNGPSQSGHCCIKKDRDHHDDDDDHFTWSNLPEDAANKGGHQGDRCSVDDDDDGDDDDEGVMFNFQQ